MRLLLCLALLAVFVAAKKKKPHGSSTPASPAAMAASGPVNSVDFPVVLPPYYKPQLGPKYNVSASNPKNFGNCLLYLEGVTVIVQNDKSTPSFAAATIGGSDNVTHTYLFNENDVQCQVNSRNSTAANNTRGEYTFNIAMVLGGDVNAVIDKDTYFTIKKGDKVEFELQFNTTSPQYWELTQVTLKSVKINQAGQKPKFIETEYISYTGSLSQKPSAMNVNSVYGYGYGCSDTQGVFFPVNVSGTEYHIGLALHNFQVELYGLYRDEKKGIVQFSRNVNDCIPTFSVGSAMGIVVALVLASVLMFGFLMLNSVQTMDRFDDPKQKQIVINVKE